MISQRHRILPPYTRRTNDLRHLAVKATGITLLLVFAMVMGFWLAVFGTFVVQFFAGVIGILLLVALWMAIDTEVDYRKQITSLFLVFVAALALWPSYLAVDIPGLPWLTPTRVVLALTAVMMLLQIAQSSRARAEMAGVLLAIKTPLIFFAVFWFFSFATFFLAVKPGSAFSNSVENLLLWNMPFFIAAWVLIDEKVGERLINLLMICLSVIFFFTVLEYIKREPIWFDYIPSFLKIDGPLFDMLMQEQMRVGEDRYRARGNFSVHLFFAQFVLMLLPFMVHAGLSKEGRKRIAAWALVVFTLVICWMTNTRTALLGYLIVFSGSVGLFALRRFLKPTNKSDLLAPSIMMAVPLGCIALIGAIVASPRLQSMLLGGAQHKGSDNVRDNQWERAISALSQNPIGHGGGSSGPLAGRPAGGTWIVDSTWINFLLDYGVLGTLGFAVFAVLIIVYGVRIYLRDIDESANLAGPAAVGIGSFLMTMYTISFYGNFQMLLMLAAVVAAARYRLQQRGLLEQPGRLRPVSTLGVPARA
jgi:uncharacterized membrane protein